MKILCIHGVGHLDGQLAWQADWQSVIESCIRDWNPKLAMDIRFSSFDDLFAEAPLNTLTVIEAMARLTRDGLSYGILDLFRSPRGLVDTLEKVRWTAGMVAQWVAHEDLRQSSRTRIAKDIQEFKPDVILAHSLGSLILYDALKRDEAEGGSLADGRTVVTFGSQIGNCAIRSCFGGRIDEIRRAKYWWHLFNEEDAVFTGPISPTTRERFQQVDTYFDIPGIADHEGREYLNNEYTRRVVWQSLAAPSTEAATARARALRSVDKAFVRKAEKPQMRALLVGVAEYPDPGNCLEGPVNDVFMMSSVLQELGYPADCIRVLLNDRATTSGIRDRMKWLLGDAGEKDTMFFFFAGHGAQIPGYGRDAEVDHVDECLVPYDFDWHSNNAITDDEFCGLYSQLPYGSTFISALDCCHAGGMTRNSGGRIRGLTPPDDVRHRSIEWDWKDQMWVPRKTLMASGEDRVKKYLANPSDATQYLGASGTVNRLGRGTNTWLEQREYKKATKAFKHSGPYLPILLEACAEGEFAYEYRHGATSYGAFTYSMCQAIRSVALRNRLAPKRSGPSPKYSFEELLRDVNDRIKRVVPETQTPQLVCPAARRTEAIPGM